MDSQQSRMRERAGSTKDVRRHPGLERTYSVEDKKCWSSVRNSSAVDQDLGRFRAFYQMGWLPYNFMDSPRHRGHDKSLEAARIARTSDLPLDQITSQISAAGHGTSNPKDSVASRQRLHGGHASDHFPPPPTSGGKSNITGEIKCQRRNAISEAKSDIREEGRYQKRS